MKKLKLAMVLIAVIVYVFSVLLMSTYADPSGASISNPNTVSGVSTPDSRSDEGGTFTTMGVSVVQQNFAWKAYIGNITATLTLDDANGYTIYDWSINQGSITGELYATRFNTVAWTGIQCANDTTIAAENTNISMGSGDGDNINSTFSFVNHTSLIIAGTTITNSTCKTLYPYYNGSAQIDNESSKFPEILIQNSEDKLIYVSNFESDETTYTDGNETLDFQMLLPDDDSSGIITTYYFYAEIDS